MNLETDIKKILLDELVSNYDNGNIEDNGISGGEEAIEKIVKLFSIHFVSQQRELLEGYVKHLEKHKDNIYDTQVIWDIDNYLKPSNCG